MARPSTEHYDLSESEKRDLIKLIEQGKPLPEKYRFLLFADKREVKLVWNGKTREVCNSILPFQTLEPIDEPRKEGGSGVSPELFDTSDNRRRDLPQGAQPARTNRLAGHLGKGRVLVYYHGSG